MTRMAQDALKKIENNGQKPKSIRRFQAFRDFGLCPDPPLIIDAYMELILQFGFIAIFSSVFPLSPLISLVANGIQLSSQIDNLNYNRRFKAESANGIGVWMSCLEAITQFAIIMNCAFLYFTSITYEIMFVGINYQ